MQGHSRHLVEVSNLTTHDVNVTCGATIGNTRNLAFDAPPARSQGQWNDAAPVRRARRPTDPTIEQLGKVPVRSFYGITAHEEVQTTVRIDKHTGGGAVRSLGQETLIIKLKC
jgi:hypothetical protein